MLYKVSFLVLLGLVLAIEGNDQLANSSCWEFMTKIPRIRQFVSRLTTSAPSVQRKLQISEFKYTIFAYTNEAYVDALGDGFDEQLSQSDTIKYHIYGGGLDSSNRIELADFYWRDVDQTLLSAPVFASQMTESDPTEQFETTTYYVNGARVVESWTNSSACYVYGLDKVLLPLAKPQTIYGFLQSTDNNLSILNNLVDIVATADPSILATLKQLRLGTGFLPTDAAFAKLEAGVLERIKENAAEARKTLLAHFSFSSALFTGKMKQGVLYPMEYSVVQGVNSVDGYFISHNGLKVRLSQADVTLSNGVVHLIDNVLTPPNEDLALALGKLENLSKFGNLVAADTDVREMLASSTRYTVFAPIDSAVGDVDRFRNEHSPEAINKLLKGLIVRGQFATSNLKQLVSADEMVLPFASYLTGVSGTRLNIVKIHNDLFISDGSSMARIIRGYSDIATANGIVHYIDAFIGNPSRGVFDTISSFGSNLNSTAFSLRQLGFNEALGVSSANTKSSGFNRMAKKWWVMFVPIESSWQTLRTKKGASALLRNRMAMSRVWQRHIFYADDKKLAGEEQEDAGEPGFIRAGNLSTINDLLMQQHDDIEPAVSVVETSRNVYYLKSNGDDGLYKILYSNIGCSNGVIHIIDRLMLVDDDPIAELNIGNPRVVGATLALNNSEAESANHMSVAYDEYGSTVDSYTPLGPIDLSRSENASVTFKIDCGDFHNISKTSANVEPLTAFSFVVPEWDVKYPNVFIRNSTNLEASNRKLFKYSFSKRKLAEAGICNSAVNPVASALPGHHQGRAYLNFTFHYGPEILAIKANISARGCLFTCDVRTCPENQSLRIIWAFSADESVALDEANDEAFTLGNVASDNRQFYLDSTSCGRMISSVSGDDEMKKRLFVACRASTLATTNQSSQLNGSTQTAMANFFQVIMDGRRN